mmetsp:Transcript_29013/g.66673  ORF Transcript_29013/g.66673 Transcript_29013/m.66673 type:complete len:213 (+) Transcript_29013:76-714(+)
MGIGASAKPHSGRAPAPIVTTAPTTCEVLPVCEASSSSACAQQATGQHQVAQVVPLDDEEDDAIEALIPEGLSPRTAEVAKRRLRMSREDKTNLRSGLVVANARFEEKLTGRPSNGDLSPLARRSSMPLWGESDHDELRSLVREFTMGINQKKTVDFEQYLEGRRNQLLARLEQEGYKDTPKVVPVLSEKKMSKLMQRRASAVGGNPGVARC